MSTPKVGDRVFSSGGEGQVIKVNGDEITYKVNTAEASALVECLTWSESHSGWIIH